MTALAYRPGVIAYCDRCSTHYSYPRSRVRVRAYCEFCNHTTMVSVLPRRYLPAHPPPRKDHPPPWRLERR